MTGLGHRGGVTAPHAGRPYDAHAGAAIFLERGQQFTPTHQFAGQAVADPDGDGRRRLFPFLDDVEMGVKGRDLVDLGHGEAHLIGKGGEMGGREVVIGVLDEMEMLDQKVAPARTITQQRPDLGQRLGVELTALGLGPSALAPGAGVAASLPRLHDL